MLGIKSSLDTYCEKCIFPKFSPSNQNGDKNQRQIFLATSYKLYIP